MSFDSRFNLNTHLEPCYHQSPSSLEMQSENANPFASQYATSGEKLMPSLFQPLHPDQLSQHIGEYSIHGHLLTPQSWTNSFNLVNLKQPDLTESSLQHPGLTSQSLGDDHPRSLTNEVDVVPSSNDQVASSPMEGKRKRSASSENLEVFQGLTICETHKIFECKLDPNCFQKFNRAEHLARHERKHTKEKPFKCHCPKAFSRLDNWRQHKQSAHKLTPVANAEQEKLLLQVQKDLQRLNKLRIATIVAGTKPMQIPTTKKARSTPIQERKRKTKEVPSLNLSHEALARGPLKAPFQPPEPPCVYAPQFNPHTIVPAVESSDYSTSPCSGRSQGFPSSAPDLCIYSPGIGSSNLEFTPQATYSNLRNFSTSPYSTPMDINRVTSFQDMLHSSTTPVPQLPSSLPSLHPSCSLLEPFYCYSDHVEPFSYDTSTFVPPQSSIHFSNSSNVPLDYVHRSSSL